MEIMWCEPFHNVTDSRGRILGPWRKEALPVQMKRARAAGAIMVLQGY
jgi:hypothetical protein